MKPTTTTTPAPLAAPDLPTLRRQLEAAALHYPELRRGLGQALADIDRRLGAEPAPARRDRRRVDSFR